MMRALPVLAGLLSFAVGVTAGGTAGVWVRDRNSEPANPEHAYGHDGPAELSGPPMAPESGPDVAAPAQERLNPFSYTFTPGERLVYRLESRVDGSGLDALSSAPISIDMMSELSLETESVDADGNALMRLTFDSVSVNGDFMESPYQLMQDGNNTFLANGGRTQIDTAQGLGSIQGVPQLEFFKEPVVMKIAPNGQVLELSGGQDLGSMLTAMPAVSALEFPEGDLQQGYQWESRIKLPVPGFGTAADARIVNTLMGYQYLDDQLCAVIRQEFISHQDDGTLDSPKSVFGEAMQFSLGTFDLQGENVVYFDVNVGRLVYCEMDLQLTMAIGDVIGSTAGPLMELLGGLDGGEGGLGDLLGGSQQGTKNLLEFSTDIRGKLVLVTASPYATSPVQ